MDDFEWTSENEIFLFKVMIGHKPLGLNKNFEMACIVEKLQEHISDISTDKIWSHLEGMYNLGLLAAIEELSIPNNEQEFELPEVEYGEMKEEKLEEKIGKTKRYKYKDTAKAPSTIEVKKEEIVTEKKDVPPLDSKDGKVAKLIVTLEKEVKKEVTEKPKPIKKRVSVNVKDSEKSKIDEAQKQINKRATRLSMKTEEPVTSGRGTPQSPLTISPATTTKRRRL